MLSAMMPVDKNGLDFARPPDSQVMMGGEENAAQPHFPPLPNKKTKVTEQLALRGGKSR
jgi:hypothetical protein